MLVCGFDAMKCFAVPLLPTAAGASCHPAEEKNAREGSLVRDPEIRA